MSLNAEQLDFAADLLRTAPTLRDAAAQWHERYPEVRTMHVSATVMRDETAALRFGVRSIYFAISAGYYRSITQRPEEADALILTEDKAHGNR
ncbi:MULTISPECIES: hypothetical protein [unclassified Paraburkholderia]|uniref:hypothetical protein n=1 Tax=unclassified Paraburkholderia TaxID=2615204 RepID=UPI00160F0A51|nr:MULTISPECIES: hypothetical protein [unclassified Paraburkholderia]MBB5446909.1 hypothetical protein [Paraburkholderia sp. WSM4177]MBB5487439.1 hypothetical protein [Paraburkholderia sp. WSM4180]